MPLPILYIFIVLLVELRELVKLATQLFHELSILLRLTSLEFDNLAILELHVDDASCVFFVVIIVDHGASDLSERDSFDLIDELSYHENRLVCDEDDLLDKAIFFRDVRQVQCVADDLIHVLSFSTLAKSGGCVRHLWIVDSHPHLSIDVARVTEPLRSHIVAMNGVFDACGDVVGCTQGSIDR